MAHIELVPRRQDLSASRNYKYLEEFFVLLSISQTADGAKMSYRLIDEHFFRSPIIRNLSDEAQLAYVYLFTTGKLSGIHYKTPKELAEGIGWPIQKWNKAVQQLTKADRVSIGYHGNMLWLKNHIDHQWLSFGRKLSPKLKKAIQKEIISLPRSDVVQEAINHYSVVFDDLPDSPVAVENDELGLELEKEVKENAKTSNFWPEAVKLTHTFIAKRLQNDPGASVPKEGNGSFDSWVKPFEKLLRLRKKELSLPEISHAIELRIFWCQADHFWHKNCLSPENFYKHYDRFSSEIYSEQKQANFKPKTQREEFEEQKARLLAKEKP